MKFPQATVAGTSSETETISAGSILPETSALIVLIRIATRRPEPERQA
jgi:hypothetical protein